MFHRLCRVMLCICVLFVLGAGAAQAAMPAGSLFAVPKTGMDGVERWGYMNESGKLVIDPIYKAAEPFDISGAAAVYNEKGEAALINDSGENLTGWQRAPQSVEYQSSIAAFRYSDRTVYFTASGSRIGEFMGAVGFPRDERVCIKTGEGEKARYGYVDLQGRTVIEPKYLEAEQFSDGRALVRDPVGICHLIGKDGTEVLTLPQGADPAYLKIYEGDLAIFKSRGDKYALYSLGKKEFLASYSYDEIQPFENKRAMMRVDTKWGLMDEKGQEIVPPTYPYMSYLGSGLYAVRGVDAGAAVMDRDGKIVYRTETYAGGFEMFRYGISWHGTLKGDLVFFNASGGLRKTVSGIENPEIVASTVVRVQRDGKTQYLNIYSGKLLYENVREYKLEGGIKVTTETYEKYLGMKKDGTEYGWYVEYPRLSGMKDEALQTRINNTLRDFFTAGPQGEFGKSVLRATYGLSVENQVLVVWANGASGDGSAVWDASIGIDLKTGARYTAEQDLFNEKMFAVTMELLPEKASYYSSPRMDKAGVTFFLRHSASDTAGLYSERVHLTFDQLSEAIDFNGACYRALTGFAGTVYPDVPYSHWAFPYVTEIGRRGLMQGDQNGGFRPEADIRTSEVCAALARMLELPEGTMPSIPSDKWYAKELGALYQAKLLEGFALYWFEPESVISRADAMQLIANVLIYQDRAGREMTSDEVIQQIERFADFHSIPEDRRRAAAICVRSGVVRGDEKGLRPMDAFTRAEFAKILLELAKK